MSNGIPGKDKEQDHNHRHWLTEAEQIYALWEKAYNQGGQEQIDRFTNSVFT